MQYFSVKITEFQDVAFEGFDASTGIYAFYDAYGNFIYSIGDNSHYHYHYRNAIDPTEIWMEGHNDFINGQNPISIKALARRVYNQRLQQEFEDSLANSDVFLRYLNGPAQNVQAPRFINGLYPNRTVNLNDETIRNLIRGLSLSEDKINIIIYTEVQPDER